jgi:putative sigma-54 modulation protein
MELKVHSIHFDADQKLLDFIQKKVDKLTTFDDRLISGEVYLRLDNADDHSNKVAEIRINAPGSEMFAKKQCHSFEEATDLAVDALRRQIKKNKEKVRGL